MNNIQTDILAFMNHYYCTTVSFFLFLYFIVTSATYDYYYSLE